MRKERIMSWIEKHWLSNIKQIHYDQLTMDFLSDFRMEFLQSCPEVPRHKRTFQAAKLLKWPGKMSLRRSQGQSDAFEPVQFSGRCNGPFLHMFSIVLTMCVWMAVTKGVNTWISLRSSISLSDGFWLKAKAEISSVTSKSWSSIWIALAILLPITSQGFWKLPPGRSMAIISGAYSKTYKTIHCHPFSGSSSPQKAKGTSSVVGWDHTSKKSESGNGSPLVAGSFPQFFQFKELQTCRNLFPKNSQPPGLPEASRRLSWVDVLELTRPSSGCFRPHISRRHSTARSSAALPPASDTAPAAGCCYRWHRHQLGRWRRKPRPHDGCSWQSHSTWALSPWLKHVPWPKVSSCSTSPSVSAKSHWIQWFSGIRSPVPSPANSPVHPPR